MAGPLPPPPPPLLMARPNRICQKTIKKSNYNQHNLIDLHLPPQRNKFKVKLQRDKINSLQPPTPSPFIMSHKAYLVAGQ